ncbi:MAG: GntR family transcriptional regulator [Rhizobiales bacterium]|nr:GntR family transcriptional regulator [Hyphomicrobiales bacterium]
MAPRSRSPGPRAAHDSVDHTGENRVSDDEVFARIHSAIAQQQLPPGTRLREDEMRQIFGVSRARIRNVFSRLAYAGVVTLEPNRGASVTRPSVKEAREIFVARRTIEATIVAEVAQRITRKDVVRLRDHIAREVDAEARRDRAEMIRLSGEFHLLLADIAGNAVLKKFLTELVTRESLVIAAYETPGRPSCSNHEHSRILEALVLKDADKATMLMQEHLDAIVSRLDLDRNSSQSIDLATIFS